jgi:hypothetical protein
LLVEGVYKKPERTIPGRGTESASRIVALAEDVLVSALSVAASFVSAARRDESTFSSAEENVDSMVARRVVFALVAFVRNTYVGTSSTAAASTRIFTSTIPTTLRRRKYLRENAL